MYFILYYYNKIIIIAKNFFKLINPIKYIKYNKKEINE